MKAHAASLVSYMDDDLVKLIAKTRNRKALTEIVESRVDESSKSISRSFASPELIKQNFHAFSFAFI